MVNDDVYGNLTPDMIPGILAKYAMVSGTSSRNTDTCKEGK
jgi:hypothetical protein